MKRLNKSLILLVLTTLFGTVSAQMSYGGKPHINDVKHPNSLAIVELPYIDNNQSLLEDEQLNAKGRPYRIGTVHDVLISNSTDGTWDTLPDGGRLWRVAVRSANATFVYPILDTYIIPDGAEVFVYSPNQDFILGKFTNANADEGKFHTQIVPGEEFIIEYYEPANAAFAGKLIINQVARGHRDAFPSMSLATKGGLGNADGNCHINVACPEGDNWRDQINGVVCISITTNNSVYSCSGSMINNTRNDGKQYLLTANHCQEGLNVRRWTFYFLYQAITCAGTNAPINKSATGAYIVANKAIQESYFGVTGSDFLLLRVTGIINPEYNVYFNGWDRTNSTNNIVGACIHHPGGDMKKISIPSAVGHYNNRSSMPVWQVTWITNAANNKGVTEEGSSGSPLFNANKRIIGQLWAGQSYCDVLNGKDYYGKLYSSWSGGGTSETRLSDWLDPTGSNVNFVNGRYASDTVGITTPANNAKRSMKLFPNPAKKAVNIELDETGIAEYAIYTQTGVAVRQGRMLLGLSAYRLDVKGLAAGSYVLSIAVNGQRFVQPLLIAK